MSSKIIYINPPKKPTNVAQAKFLWILLDAIGWPITILGIFSNLDNAKSLIISLIALGFLLTRWWYYVVQKKQAVRKEEIEIKMKELKYKIDQLDFDRKTSKVNGQ